MPQKDRATRRLSSLCGQLLAPRPCAGENFTIEPVPGRTLGAVVKGLSLAEGLSPEAEKRIKEAFLKHAVLVFEGQQGLTLEAQIAFGKLFGKLEFEKNFISNQRQSGEMIKKYANDESGRFSPQYLTIIGTHAWHQDSTYMPVSSKAGIIYAEKMPPPGHGGETEWLDMRAAYEALDEETRGRIETLSAYHSGQQSGARRLGVFPKHKDNQGKGYGANGVCYLRPLVKTHPETGRKSIFLGAHAFGIPGMSREESTALLDELVERACQPPRVYTHKWRVGDLVLWDERCVLHRALPYDHAREPRKMHGTRVAGDKESESALPSPGADKLLEAELAWVKENRVWETYSGIR